MFGGVAATRLGLAKFQLPRSLNSLRNFNLSQPWMKFGPTRSVLGQQEPKRFGSCCGRPRNPNDMIQGGCKGGNCIRRPPRPEPKPMPPPKYIPRQLPPSARRDGLNNDAKPRRQGNEMDLATVKHDGSCGSPPNCHLTSPSSMSCQVPPPPANFPRRTKQPVIRFPIPPSKR